MSFDYSEIRDKQHSSGTQWAAYSDLFMVLAFIFLLMYMVSSLRTGMHSVATHAKIAEVKQELEYYESSKNKYLSGEANEQESQVYEDILEQLTLLESQARDNKNRLAREMNQQEIRENSLNRYQKMITSMVNATIISKASASDKIAAQQQQNKRQLKQIELKESDLEGLQSRLKSESMEVAELQDIHIRETRQLEKKYQALKRTHDSSQDNIASLSDTLKAESDAKAELKENHNRQSQNLSKKYQDIKSQHDEDKRQLASLKHQLRMESVEMDSMKNMHEDATKILQQKLDRMTAWNSEGQTEVTLLRSKLQSEAAEKLRLKHSLTEETDRLQDNLKSLKSKQTRNQQEIAKLEDKLINEMYEKEGLQSTHLQLKKDLSEQLQALKGRDNKNQDKMAALEDQLEKKEGEKVALKDSYDEIAGIMKDKIDRLNNKNNKNQDKIASLNDANRDVVDKLNSDLSDAQKNLKKTSRNLDRAKGDLAKTSGELKNARKLENRRRDIAKRIKDNFKQHGILADVDSETGDVILDFGANYFDTDSHMLKPGMERTIRKAIPVYAESLFGSRVSASLISSVEIIGFASPTYGGKPIDPTELSMKNRIAVNYNLDLSYKRARSIFEYVFNPQKIKFEHQETMVHLINVTGRSFFAEKVDTQNMKNLTVDEFCDHYNCMKSQRVIIKFGLSDKGEVS